MKTCCQQTKARRLAGWLLPGGLLVLMPKCPACLAGYFALFTGIGISLPVATTLRYGLIVFCVSLLVLRFLSIRKVRRARTPGPTWDGTPHVASSPGFSRTELRKGRSR